MVDCFLGVEVSERDGISADEGFDPGANKLPWLHAF
jgi:hypothetical protein